MTEKGNARSSGYERIANDWYVESRASVEALLDVESFPNPVWDPAAGGGNIPSVCKSRGYDTVASDVVDRGCLDALRCDFFAYLEAPYGSRSIISNPPFSRASEFVIHGLSLVEKVAVLQRTVWLEGNKRHQTLFRKGCLARMWQFSSRVSMPPGGSETPAQNGSVAYAWFVFERGHNGPFTGGWLP